MRLAWIVILFTSFSQTAAGEPKPAAATPAQMVDAIANRNQPPKLFDQGRPPTLALFPETYDWEEEKRVQKAIEKLYQDTSVELWDELVRREGDSRYSITLADRDIGDAYIISVGGVCSELAYSRLTGVFQRHLPAHPGGTGVRVSLEISSINDLAAWRKERKDWPFYQLQIEVCKEAVEEVAKIENVPQQVKDLARKKIEFEIETMKSTKQPLFGKRSLYGAYESPIYTAELAAKVREAVKMGRRFLIWK
jgi:hypothetical protein